LIFHEQRKRITIPPRERIIRFVPHLFIGHLNLRGNGQRVCLTNSPDRFIPFEEIG